MTSSANLYRHTPNGVWRNFWVARMMVKSMALAIGSHFFELINWRFIMRSLVIDEVNFVSGAGTLAAPITNPQSETGKLINDIAGGLNEFGSWLGGAIYDATHK